MLYILFEWWTQGKPYAYWYAASFRGVVALLVAFAVVWALGPKVIRALIKRKIGDRPEFDHEALNKLTQDKKNTPTMGGILIVIAIVVTTLLLADVRNFYVKMALFCTVWLAIVGGVDDWLKLTINRRTGTRAGLRTWEKLVFQVALGALLAIFIFRYGQANADYARWQVVDAPYSPFYNMLNLPFFKGHQVTLFLEGKALPYFGVALPTWAFAILTVIVIAGTSNAVNLTDGMDGLASGCMVLTALVFMVVAAVVGSFELTRNLFFFPIAGAGELAVVCGAVAGACLGFLWYNAYPAHVFMGDTGALPLGGLMGYVAIVTRTELMLLIVGGIFVIEVLSVVIQVAYYKTTKKRVFRCTPLHHHFHLGGWSETQVVMRFWLLAALFAAFAVATLRLR
jgi:phospho-N-acetylmuramoyl-pentapeptide-transferase